MSSIYDNWERLVHAILDREKLRVLARLSSMETSFNSSISSAFNISPNNSQFISVLDCVPGSLMDQVIKAAGNTVIFKQECLEIKSKAENLAGMLRQAASTSNNLYSRPTRSIVSNTELVLEKALELVMKCNCVFGIIPSATFQNMSSLLENSIEDVSWLIPTSYPEADVEPRSAPITINEPILCLVWKQITTLYVGSMEDRSAAAASLAYLARDSDQHGNLIVEEGGVGPLLKLVEEGNSEGQKNAIRAIEWLAKNPENVHHMIDAGVPISLGTTHEFQNSREQIENEIMEATTEEFQNSREQIENEIAELRGNKIISICGMGGVGKRTLTRLRIINRVEDENRFQDILSSVKVKSFISRMSHGIFSSASNLIKRCYNAPWHFHSKLVRSHKLHSSFRFPWHFHVSVCCVVLWLFLLLFWLTRAIINYYVPHSFTVEANPPEVSVLDVVGLAVHHWY